MRLLILFLVTLASIVISYYYIDVNVVFYIESHQINKYYILKKLSETPNLIIPILVFFVILSPFLFKKYMNHKIFQMFFSATFSVLMAAQIKDFLKYIFGRYWADTWINNNPSLIVNNVYGFQFFQKASSSFPSGHTTVTFAFCTVCILYYPKLKYLFILPMLAVCIGQIGMHYHFVSDVIAGAFLGYVVSKFLTYYLTSMQFKKLLALKYK
ncbi:phosphatase PAP2 family protein [Fluviispira multicolorata]|uniref:Phosphatase PAP2 family protein n=1 Tax=Fluviispira multicolorata TaxID=2654512 RepID=A0A833N4M5_9BACT|nr:phosphatase PAP2 family protein [Fluviispira multicolorata]KAB8032181.1 phosphatase PAP2 family protein [Fluviispira multicolorata]